MNNEQIQKKQEKLHVLIEKYRELKDEIKSIAEFSKLLGEGFSRSTIQRYFHEMYDNKMISEKEYVEICEWLKNSAKVGYSLGGKTSQERHGFSKDELGHFKGGK